MCIMIGLEFVTGGVELLRTILHGYAGGLIFMKLKKKKKCFLKRKLKYFYTFNHNYSEKSSKRANSTNPLP